MSVSEHSGPGSSLPSSTNNDRTLLSHDIKSLSLSIAAATALPTSSPITSHVEEPSRNESPSPSSFGQPLRSPLRRTPSSSSIGRNERSTTPTLHKRTSLSSLQGIGGVTPPRSPAFRRTSSNLASSSNMSPRPILSAPLEEPVRPPMTAAAAAQKYFQKELDAHHGTNGTAPKYGTVVILQDNCYGHRYSRPRTSRASLNTIVERPERIHASILGLAAAYVRLGGRHADGLAAPDLKKEMGTIAPIPFKIHKTNRTMPLTSQAVTAIHGAKWMNELSAMCESAETKLALSGKELTRPTDSENVNKNNNGKVDKAKLHEGDLYLCAGSLGALEGALGGVCEGVDAVFTENGPKRAFVCIRPPGHHCSADYPSGFCWLNNVHVGISHASLTHGLTHAAIIDFDLHHGDGSQAITWDHNTRIASLPRNTPQSKKTAIGYFSLHDINSYPCEMGDDEKVRSASLCLENAHGQSIWNVHLQPWKTDAEFWELYKDRYMIILAKARAFLQFHTDRLRLSPTHPQPKGAIFLSAGFDASEWESPGMQRHQVNVPTDFYARFTHDVVSLAEEAATGVNGKVISVLEGGYSDRALMSGVLSHVSGLAEISEPTKPVEMKNGLGHEMGMRLGRLTLGDEDTQMPKESETGSAEIYDSRWWALPRLEEIENLINPSASPVAPKRPRSSNQPTYTSATQSFTAKIVSSPPSRRSFSSSNTNIHQSTSSSPRSPSPPPPPIDWATAAHELSKLLIPSDRQTQSCKPEELNAEASRARRDRHSTIGLPTDTPASETKMQTLEGKMQLRDRRNIVPKSALEGEEKPAPRSSRRRTTADIAILNQETQDSSTLASQLSQEKPVKQTRRRLSVASSAGSVNGERTSDMSLTSIDNLPRQDELVIKKARTLGNSRSESSKARLVKKPPPVPRVSSGYSSASKLPASSTTLSSASKPGPVPTPPNGGTDMKDMENLTGRMTKMSIKLNVPSRQGQDTNDSKQKPVARGRPKSAAPKLKKIPETSNIKDVNNTAETAKVPDTSNFAEEKNATTELPVKIAIVGQPHSGSAETSKPPHPMLAELSSTSSFKLSTTQILPLSHGSQSDIPLSLEAQQPSKIQVPAFLPPAPTIPAYDTPIPQTNFSISIAPQSNEKTPILPSMMPSPPHPPPPSTPKRTKQDLPVFTSTSPILFGKLGEQTTSSIDYKMISENVENPFRQPLPLAQESAIDAGPSQIETSIIQQKNPASAAITVHRGANKGEKNADALESDIWTVPDTPQLHRTS